MTEPGDREDSEPNEQAPGAGAASNAPPAAPQGPWKQPTVMETMRAVHEALRPLGRRRVLRSLVIVGGLGMLGVLAFSGLSLYWTSQPSFCNRCHVMKKYVTAWEVSPHKDVNCESCHTPTGTLGFLGGKVSGLQVLVNYFRGNYEDSSFNAAVPNGSCLRCHDDIMKERIRGATTGVLVSHRNIVETGGKCLFCHSAVAHGEAVPVGSHTEPKMATCFKCHDDKTAPSACTTCHDGDVPPGAKPHEVPDVG